MNHRFPFQPIQLPYSYISLSPYCDPDTLYLHHKFYQDKVKELNHLVVQHRLTDWTLEDLITKKINLPVPMANRIRDTAGAVYNHELYFDGIKGRLEPPPLNRLVGVLITVYGSLDRFRQLLLEAADSLPGAGWVWLVTEKSGGPHIVITENNDVVDLGAVQPLLVADLWEHAYFLDSPFDKEKYMNAWFSFIDWDKAEERFSKAQLSNAH